MSTKLVTYVTFFSLLLWITVNMTYFEKYDKMSSKKNSHLIKYVQIHEDRKNIFGSYGFHFMQYPCVEMGHVFIELWTYKAHIKKKYLLYLH